MKGEKEREGKGRVLESTSGGEGTRAAGDAKRKRKKSTPMSLKAQARGKSHQESRNK